MQDDQAIAPATISKEVLPFDPEGKYPDGTQGEIAEVYVNRETNPFAIPCAITRGYFRVGGETYLRHDESGKFYPFSRIGESVWKFKWILRDDTHVCELPIGMKIQVDYDPDFGTVEIYSKKKFISILHAPQIYDSVAKAILAGSITGGSTFAIVPGTISNIFSHRANLARTLYDGLREENLNEAISLDTLMRKFRYDQWNNGDRTVDSVSRWLMEDLRSRLRLSSRYTDYDDPYDKKTRPDGLLFFNKGLGKFAKVMCRDFEWYYKDGKACKETHEHEVHILAKINGSDIS